MKGYLDYVNRMAIYNSFIISTSIIAILSGCSPVNHHWTDIQKRLLRFVCNDFVSNYSELLEKCVSGGEALRYMSMVVYKCVNNMTPQYLNEMLTLKKCTYYLRDRSLLDRSAARLTDCSLKSLKIYGAKMWNWPLALYKIGVSFDAFKTWSKLGLEQPANVVSAVCLQLDFPIIAMYNNLTNHNCLFVLIWWCGLIWSTMCDYVFCYLHLSGNSLYFRTANIAFFICRTDTK